MNVRPAARLGAIVASILIVTCCGTGKKAAALRKGPVTASIALAGEKELPEFDFGAGEKVHRDTLKVQDADGREILIMKAVKDDNGEMVAHDVIDAAVVTARFRNVAERHGRVDIEFQITVPEAMQDSRWQLRFQPDMAILGDTVRLDPVIITGREYRRAQLRGYQQYQRFIDSIITDSTVFIDRRQLEIFLERNIPALYAFRADSSFVSDEEFRSHYGVTEQQAVRHYTNKLAWSWNERKKVRTDLMYRKLVKVPIITEGLRLDTVMQAVNGDFIYNYVQTVNTKPKLRKVDICLRGGIFEQDRKVYSVPKSDPLTFYISSLSSFVDNTERYLTEVTGRRVEANTACYIDFALGRADVDLALGDNRQETGRIKTNLRELLLNEKYDLDSIIVTASCSPEGRYATNEKLSRMRSESVSRYFSTYLAKCRDSIRVEQGIHYDIDGKRIAGGKEPKIAFIARSNPENWEMLDLLVASDSVLSPAARQSYFALAQGRDPDEREAALQKQLYYRHLREHLYPRLRTVRFDFHLHRKGMIHDTLRTTMLDTVYMKGVQAIRDRDYESAVTLLRPYGDFNTAVAYSCMDYNESALSILKELEPTPQVDYMLAVIWSRKGDDRAAVEHYLRACHANQSFIHRGNLDPEISSLIRKYGLEKTLQTDTTNL